MKMFQEHALKAGYQYKKRKGVNMTTALITGITGQDGSYLAEFLLSKGYTAIGMSRRTSTVTFERIHRFRTKSL